MIPINYRNATFEEIKKRLVGDRLKVLDALREYGPCTTRELAGYMEWDILNVRPRITELGQLGCVICLDKPGNEGCYAALDPEAIEERFLMQQRQALNPQLNFALN